MNALRAVAVLTLLGAAAQAAEPTAAQLRPCLAKVDDRNLEALIACYYEPGGRFLYPGPFDLLAAESARLLQKGSFPELATDFTVVTAKVVGKETIGARKVARVSVRHRRGACEVTATQSWIEEGSRWRKLWFPLTEQAAQKFDAEGPLLSIFENDEDWLRRDPYAIRPIASLLEVLRGAPELVKAGMLARVPVSSHGTPEALLARLARINPDDDEAIGVLIQFAPALEEARAAFARLPKNACSRPAQLAFLIDRFEAPAPLLAFLKENQDDSPGVVDAAQSKLVELGAAPALAEYLTPARAAAVRQRWTEKGRDRAANAAVIAVTLSKLEDRRSALAWKKYALEIDPGNEGARTILSGVKW